MNIMGTFEAALLCYIQQHVDQLAESILDWSQTTPSGCRCDWSNGDTCFCDTLIRMQVSYRVPREVQRHGYQSWSYDGDLGALIRMLDNADLVN